MTFKNDLETPIVLPVLRNSILAATLEVLLLVYPELIFVTISLSSKMETDYSVPMKVFKVSSHSCAVEVNWLTLKKVVNGLLMGFALFLATARVVIQLHSQRKLLRDDFVLMFACSTFIASQALLFALKIENIYWLSATVMPMNPQTLASMLEDPTAFHRQVVKFQQILNFSVALTWTSICAVKISFLLFFYQLITRLRKLILAWRVIFGVIILFWAFCICALFISCPHINPTSSSTSALHPPLNSAPHW